MYDVLIIGCGIVGSSVAYELSKYKLSIAVVERFNDVANGVTKANSAILHSGFDPEPDTLCATLNIKGIKMAKEICEKLGVERRELPSLVIAFDEREMKMLDMLYSKGIKNGVKDMKILTKEEALTIEPSLNPAIAGALYSPNTAIVNPWGYAIAMSETAALNGVDFYLSCEVTSIDKKDDYFIVHTAKEDFETKYIINSAGSFGANICNMVGDFSVKQTNFSGQYYVLDKSEGAKVNSVIFSCPDELGFKGVLVAPTVHGNLIVGPDADPVENGDCVGTKAENLSRLKKLGLRSVPSINFREIIHEYAGVRPTTQKKDFIIEESTVCPRFINLIGIKSPGLSAAPAIALEGINILKEKGLQFTEKQDYVYASKMIRFTELSDKEKQEIIKNNPLYGKIICRCETITEGEIVDAIHRPIVPRSIDAIKRRCKAGMGRCQGGFCGPRVHEILARELGVSPIDIPLDEDGSYIITGKTKEGACAK